MQWTLQKIKENIVHQVVYWQDLCVDAAHCCCCPNVATNNHWSLPLAVPFSYCSIKLLNGIYDIYYVMYRVQSAGPPWHFHSFTSVLFWLKKELISAGMVLNLRMISSKVFSQPTPIFKCKTDLKLIGEFGPSDFWLIMVIHKKGIGFFRNGQVI